METLKKNQVFLNESTKRLIDFDMRSKLRQPFPAEAIKQHPTKTYLSTIKAIYIVERLNDVFSIGRWTFEHEVIKETESEVLIRGKLRLFDYDADIPSQYGSHTIIGKGVELADGYKSAVTDALSKCASYLEIGIDVFKGKGRTEVVKNTSVKEEPPSEIVESETTDPEKLFITDCKLCETSLELLDVKKTYQTLIDSDTKLQDTYRRFEVSLLIKDSFKACTTLKDWSKTHKSFEQYHSNEFYIDVSFKKYDELKSLSSKVSV